MLSRRDVLSHLAMAAAALGVAPAELFAQAQAAAQRFGKDKLIIRSIRKAVPVGSINVFPRASILPHFLNATSAP